MKCWNALVLEYNPDAIADEEIIKMVESAKPMEN